MPNAEINRTSNKMDLVILLLNTAYICNTYTTLNFMDACWCGIKL